MSQKPDLTTPDGRLRWARLKAGLESAAAAAERFGWEGVTYRSHENGTRGFTGQAIDYAKAFKIPVEWLLFGIGDPEAFVDDEMVRVIKNMRKMSDADRRELGDISEIKARRNKA